MTPSGHKEQERPDSCVAACLRMLLAKDGEEADEAALSARLGPGPIELRSAQGLAEYRYLGLGPDGVGLLLGLVRLRWVVVSVTDGAAACWARENGLTSPRGPLATPDEEQARIHHAIVLVGEQDGVLRYLDPWCRPEGQPASVALDRFVRAWVGSALYRPALP